MQRDVYDHCVTDSSLLNILLIMAEEEKQLSAVNWIRAFTFFHSVFIRSIRIFRQRRGRGGAMPIVIKDYSWRETEGEVQLSLPLKGAKPSGVDVFTTEQYIKVNYPPFLFEVQLFATVVEEQCSVKIGNGVVEFRLLKARPGIWGRLATQEDKINMAERRLEAIVHSHKKATEESEVRVKKKREEEQFAISQQMKLEEQEAARIEAVKQVRTMVDSGQRMVLFTFLGRER